jgi:adenylate cyclase
MNLIKRLHRRFMFRSIQTRVMTATTLLIVTIVGTGVWAWATTESDFYRQQKRQQVRSLALTIAQSLQIELSEQNWSNMQGRAELLLQTNPEFVYAIITDAKLSHQIVAASPIELSGQYVPDLVPLPVTQQANRLAGQPRIKETVVLRDVVSSQGTIRAHKGERVIEAAVSIAQPTKEGLPAGTLRIGITLRQLDQAIAQAVVKALTIGSAGLGVGLLGAYWVAQRLTKPVVKLRNSAAKIAAGDLNHRAEVDIADEIGALAKSFNEMSASLQASFGQLQKTVESFERFVPNKFLQAIAPQGIENIQVGQSSTHTIAILFCDIRGYTAMSEGLTPEETFIFLNDYLACMGQVIDQCGGFIDKYIGDAIMALFDQDHTDGAVRAAMLMQEALIGFNAKRVRHQLPKIEVGIGIHRGQVIMGTIGFTSRIESTVIGDAVNLASRVEGLTKQWGCDILVTDAVVEALQHPVEFDLHLVDAAVKVKGKESPIAIYQLELPTAVHLTLVERAA